MSAPFRILFVEDSPMDRELVAAALQRDGLHCEFVYAATEQEMRNALDSTPCDLILADFTLPSFGGEKALALARAVKPDVPFIFVSGTIGEARAVETMKAGATDYVLKDHLNRLGLAVRRALREAREQAERGRATEMLRVVLDNIPAFVFWKDLKSRYLGCNNLFAQSAGLNSPSAIIGKTDYDLPWRETAERYATDDRRLIETNTAKLEFEEPQSRPDGSTLWLKTSKVPLRNTDGSVFGILGVYVDITERKQAEEQLRLQSAALNAAANAIVITNREGTIEWVNDAFSTLTGYTGKEAVGQNLRLLKSGRHDAAFYRQMWAVISSGQAWHGVLVNKRKNGTLYNEEMTITPVRGERSEVTHFIAIKIDVTERLKAEKLALRSQRMESLGTLAGGIAHDLNNALAPVMMSIELLRMQYPNEPQILDTISASTKRGADMVRQLLTFAKGAEGERIPLQPVHMLKEMRKIIKSTFPKNIELVLRSGSSLPLVAGDATQLHQVLLNLCVNARDAMPGGGRLTLQAETKDVDEVYAASLPDAKPGRYVVLRVQDTGTGIPPDVQDRIFDPFFTTKNPDKGTGLGLSTVLGIVKSHGGFLQVYSEVGKGSTFAVYLPIEREAGGTEHLRKPSEKFRGQGETILLVDDEASVRDIGRAVLERLNLRALTASDGAEGFALAMEHKEDIRGILFDLQMPHMDGLAFARALRRMLPKVPMVAMSGILEELAKAELDALGITLYLAKPFTEHQLAEELQKLFALQ